MCECAFTGKYSGAHPLCAPPYFARVFSPHYARAPILALMDMNERAQRIKDALTAGLEARHRSLDTLAYAAAALEHAREEYAHAWADATAVGWQENELNKAGLTPPVKPKTRRASKRQTRASQSRTNEVSEQ